MRPTFTEEALYTQTTPHPRTHLPPMTRAQTTKTQALLCSHLYPCIVGHNLSALEGAMLTVTTKLAQGGSLLGRSIRGLRTQSFPPIL